MKRVMPLAAASRIIAFLCLLGALGGVLSCATPPAPNALPPEEIIRRKKAMQDEIIRELESQLTFAHDKELELYLREVALRLASSRPELGAGPIGVYLLKDSDTRKGPWRDLSLLGTRIYLSVSVLKECEFETEVAAVIALELAHLIDGDATKRIEAKTAEREQELAPTPETLGIVTTRQYGRTSKMDFFGQAGVYAFTSSEQAESASVAATLLYSVGFDPRGLISALGILQRNPKRSWIDPDTLAKMIESARKRTATYPPLRNPVVRSNKFVSLKPRIKNL